MDLLFKLSYLSEKFHTNPGLSQPNPAQRQKALIYYQILWANSWKKFLEASVENLYVDTGD